MQLLATTVPFFLLILTLSDAQEKTVTTPNGAIRGRLEYSMRKGVRFFAFNNIPFAKPPLGALRFQEPQPVDPWTETLDATVANGPICLQVAEWGNFSGQTEDCLYLNVYTPMLSSPNASGYSVIFWIFGGGFNSGASGFYQAGPHYLIEDDVIIVTTNYRVGPFGFLSTGDEVIPGNNGLKDQNLALRWVRDNIGYFGGDPQKVTLMGGSAGGASVTYHFMSKQSKGLFRGGISHSGSLLCPWSYTDQATSLAYQLAAQVNPTFNSSATSSELLALLRSVSAEQINAAAKTFQDTVGNEQIVQGFFWAPVIEPDHENAFITEPMYSAVEGGRLEHVPLLIGINSEEALDRIADVWFPTNVKQYDDNVTLLVNRNMHFTDYESLFHIGNSIRRIYTSGLLQDNLANAIRYFSDMSFTRSIIHHAHMQSINSDVYFYQFSYHGKLGGRDNYIAGAERVAHSEEGNYVWCYGNYSAGLDSYPAEDVLTSDRFRRLLTNFVKYGNPTPEPSILLQNISWPKVQNWNFQYLNINNSLTIEMDPKKDVYQKWNLLYESVKNETLITY